MYREVFEFMRDCATYLTLVDQLQPGADPIKSLRVASTLVKSGFGETEIEEMIKWYLRLNTGPPKIDWEKLNSESDRMLEKWKRANGDRIFPMDESPFEYGFELGWRIAKGESIE